MKNQNSFPKVVTSPTKYTGGKNPGVKVVTSPTKYTGGLNKVATNIPKSK